MPCLNAPRWLPPLALSLFLLATSATARAQNLPVATVSAEEQQRRELYQQGKQAIDTKRWTEALGFLHRAWALRPSFEVALSMANAEYNLQLYRDAAEHLAYYLQHFPTEERDKSLFNAQKAFALVKEHVSVLHISVDREAEISINDKPAGVVLHNADLFVDPGEQKVEAHSGAALGLWNHRTEAGQEYLVALQLVAPTAASSPAPGDPNSTVLARPPGDPAGANPPGGATTERPSMVPVYALGITAVAALGVGVGFQFAASSKAHDLDQLLQKNTNSACSSPVIATTGDCQEADDLTSSRERDLTVSTTAFIVGGASALGALSYYLFVVRPKTRSTGLVHSDIRVHGATHPHGATLWLSGKF